MTNFYNYEDKDPNIAEWGIVGRAQSWGQARSAAQELLKRKPSNMKLQIRKNNRVNDWPWILRWVPEEGL